MFNRCTALLSASFGIVGKKTMTFLDYREILNLLAS
jgi:hypothetical protein